MLTQLNMKKKSTL